MMKWILLPLGFLSVALGILGIFLPLLPTTPFLLLAAAIFYRSSPRAHSWLLNHRYLGTYIRHFCETKSIPLRVKIISVSLVWITFLHGAFFLLDEKFIFQCGMILLAAGITCYILSFKTLRK